MKWQDVIKDSRNRYAEVEKKELIRLLEKVREMPKANILAHLDDEAKTSEINLYESLVSRLANHEPIQYLIGKAPFMDFEVKVTPDVLIPRFDTEVLVREALAVCQKKNLKVLDLCTGSGIIAIALARSLPHADIYASDLSLEALAVALENAKRLEVCISLKQGNLFAPWANQLFDVILSNPPYISEAEYTSLSKDIHFEPKLALLAGKDGLDVYRQLIKEAKKNLVNHGQLLVEIGSSQGEAVMELFKENGYRDIIVIKDEQGLDRVVKGEYEYDR